MAAQEQPRLNEDEIEEFEAAPAPLSFLKVDSIHSENQSIIEREQQRWRLLKWTERIYLTRYVSSLKRKLNKAGYNQKVVALDELRRQFKAAATAHQGTTYLNATAKRQAVARLKAMQTEGRGLIGQLDELKETYERFSHYSGWLEYERQHRKELIEEQKRERRIRKEMDREAGWLQQIIYDVFRKTNGCHYVYTDDGKQRTKIPRFERSVIMPDAHWFYLSASKRTFLGWKWKLPYGVTIQRLTEDDVLANLRAATKRQVDAVWSETGQLIFRVSRLDSPDALPKQVKWRDAMRFYPKKDTVKLPYTIGANEHRKFRWFDLASDPHVLVAGKSQSGKSNQVNGWIGTWCSTHTPDELRIVLIDQKGGIEFSHWHELPHLLWDVVKTLEEVAPVLNKLVDVMRRRMAMLERVKAKTFDDYNARVDSEFRLARLVVVIDEMNTFVGLGRQTDEIHNLIMLLVSQGRAVGLHIVASTQHPEVRVIPGRIKTNMSIRLSGAMPTVGASMIVLDNPEAARIPNIPGRFVAVVGLQTLIVQAPRIFDEDIAGVVSSCKQMYPTVAETLNELKNDKQPALGAWDEQRVLSAVIEWTDGHLSGQRLHKMLGPESPGERHLSRICTRLIDQCEAVGHIEHAESGRRWVTYKKRRAVYLKPQSDQPDKTDTTDSDGLASDYVSDYATEASHE